MSVKDLWWFHSFEFLPAATKLDQGNIFTSMCREFCPQGGDSASVHAGMHPSRSRPPQGTRHPTPRSKPPPREQTPPQEADSSIRSTSGGYASYWSAFLSYMFSVNSGAKRMCHFTVKGFEPATLCVRNQDATTASARHMWEAESLNCLQFMFQWFFQISWIHWIPTPLRENSILFY